MPTRLPTPKFDQTLPIFERREEIARAIRDNPVIVLTGETGSGKTTQLPQICLSIGRGERGMIAHTQPRRLAARAVATRLAEELGVPLGGAVGVKVRFGDRTSDRTVLKLMTDGILLAEIQNDPDLRAYDTIIIDEAHERSLNIDFLLGYLKQLLPRRPDLRVIVTSATIEPSRFARFFARGGKDAPIINVSGRLYPIEVRYRPVEMLDAGRLNPREVADAVQDVLRIRLDGTIATPESAGDVLVFLPGEGEIRHVGEELRRAGVDAEVLPLFSRLSNDEQDRIFRPGERRRVVLCTNVAETTLTVPRIRFVVDAGLARISRYDSRAKIERLLVEPISRASADQRSGRCGRIASGVAVRLYSEASFRERTIYTDPEIRRTNLASVILHLMMLDLGAIDEFPFLDPPDAHAAHDGYETLFELGAIDRRPMLRGEGAGQDQRPALTPVGRQMARVPADPRIARVLIGAGELGALAEVLVLAAALSIQDPRERPAHAQDAADRAQVVFRHESSDFLSLLKVWDQYRHVARGGGGSALREWCREHYLSPTRMREWMDTHEQLGAIAEELDLPPNSVPASEEAIHKSLLTGLISNLACREEGQASYDYRGVRGNVVSIFPGSVLFKKNPKWIMAAEIVQTSKLYARTLAKIEPAWIEELAGHMFQRQLSDKHYDSETNEPSAWERVTMNGIVVVPRRRVAIAATDAKAARAVFIREGLANPRFDMGASFVQHNRRVLAQAKSAEAKLRRRGLVRSDVELVSWFEARLPAEVCDPASFRRWADAEASAARDKTGSGGMDSLCLSLADVLRPDAMAGFDETKFPSSLLIESAGDLFECPIEYAFEPGKDHDGVTVRVPLIALREFTSERACWLVPGMLEVKVLALLKALPKAQRASLESIASLPELAHEVTEVLDFGTGDLAMALSETLRIVRGTEVSPKAWAMTAVPSYLQLRLEVNDREGKELASGRDIAELHQRLAPRYQRAVANAARERFERQGITEWIFGDLPEHVPVEQPDGIQLAYPALLDESSTVSLTLLGSRDAAIGETSRGIRRLFTLACKEELSHRLRTLTLWPELCKWYKGIGPAEELQDAISCLIVERAFLGSQPPIRSRGAFEARQQEQWGRLPQATIEVAEVMAKLLEPRFRVAHRISGGTPRLWANSIADVREHAAYLMPPGFLRLAPWERLREYPRYAQGMWERLLRLREDGSGTEHESLATMAPHWKRFTGWVATGMADERSARSEHGDGANGPKTNARAPLPQARRVTTRVNMDAAGWAMQPGNLPTEVVAYRWALEEYRLTLFVPELTRGGKSGGSARVMEEAWRAVENMNSR